MVISDRIIHQIVVQISGLIKQNIIFIGPDGIIRDSTDASRIGTVHGGALKIIREGLTDLIIESSDEYEGAVNGINLPIVFMDEIVGIIGITGSSSVVASYGQIVKRMTEIMLQESFLREQETIVQKSHDRFLDEWVFDSFDLKDPQEFSRRAEALQIDTAALRRVAIINIQMEDRIPADEEMTEISRWVKRFFRNDPVKGEVFRTTTRMICLFGSYETVLLRRTLLELSRYLQSQYGCSICIGLSSDTDFTHIKEAYDRADFALMLARQRGLGFLVYDELDPGQFFANTPKSKMQEYLDSLFGAELLPELDDIIAFIKVYIDCNGSIKAVSEALSMHKNTVQYKLRRLAEQTSYDPRRLKDLNAYILAIQFYDYMKK